MPKEIERKFLVNNSAFKQYGEGVFIRQGYLSREKENTVRIRLEGDQASINIKGINIGATRKEFEYKIPGEEAETMLDKICKKPLVEKYRHFIEYRGNTWEVDEFVGENKGLVIAEIELKDEQQHFEKPEWVGEEVTGRPEYFNSNLSLKPYRHWQEGG